MHRYDELERLYYRNKIKKYTYISVVVLLFVTGIYFGIGHLSKTKQKEAPQIKVDFKKITDTKPVSVSNDKNLTVEKKSLALEVKKKTSVKKTAVKNIHKNSQTNVKKETGGESLTPNLSFVVPKIKPGDMQNANNSEKKKPKQNVKKIPAKNKNSEKTVTSDNIQVIPQIKEENINIKDLINTYNKEPSYDTAIVISHYFYNKNDLDNAKLWALRANNIDPSKYQSWKMFALILLKKHDKIKAKEVLKIYLNDYGNNDEIYKLLRSIDE